jgi:uncharacterized protein YndB with AHSA1/START domain
MEITNRDLTITRLIDAPPEAVFKCWTTPSLITQWFTPPPYETIRAEIDLRPGGSSLITMRSPEGVEIPNPGIYLEVIPNQKIVATDAYTSAWELADKPFMTLILTFENVNGKTQYTAVARHWSVADREAHENMGFHTGWGIATDQLAALAASL